MLPSILFRLLLCIAAASSMVVENTKGSTCKVAIIGGGFAGLGAAYEFCKAKERLCQSLNVDLQVQVIEARDRLGGRVHQIPLVNELESIHEDNLIVDAGAQWIHECSSKNPLIDSMNEIDLHWTPQELARSKRNSNNQANHHRHNVWIDIETATEIPEGIRQTVQRFWYKTLHEYELSGLDLQTSLGDLVRDQVKVQDWSRFSKDSHGDIESEQIRRLLSGLQHRTEIYEGGPLDQLSAILSYDTYIHLGGPDRIPPGGSYNNVLQSILNFVAPSIDSTKLNARASCIQQAHDGAPSRSVQIHIDQDSKTEIIDANYVICTVPLGVLQQRRIQFVPDLPDKRWQSIDRLGFGNLEKVILRFPHKFWKDSQFHLLHNDPNRINSLHDTSPNESNPILTIFLGGGPAERMQGMADAEVVQDVLNDLRLVFEGTDIPEPEGSHVTRWHRDTFTGGGAYSFEKVGACVQDYRTIGEPFGRICFAGEHTSITSHATVHGAWASGIQNARHILEKLKAS